MKYLLNVARFISELSLREWGTVTISSVLLFIFYMIVQLEQSDQLISLILTRNEATFYTVDNCILRVEKDNHILSVPYFKKDYTNYSLRLSMVSVNNNKISEVDFVEMCHYLQHYDVIKQGDQDG